jgi:DNA-binding transcriptional regulator YdaS (Cro superfamily)
MPDLSIGLKAVIQYFRTKTAVAETLGVKRAAVSQWKSVPVRHVLDLERATKGQISRHVMRPDVYPSERTQPDQKRKAA